MGEIIMFAGDAVPNGYARAEGQLLSIQQNQALFSLLGTTYGGNGQTTFLLPDLRGRSPMSFGTGPGLTPRVLGETSGSESVTLTTSEMPAHTHQALAATAAGNSDAPGGRTWGADPSGDVAPYVSNTVPAATMSHQAIGSTGGSQPHENRQPFLCISFVIFLEGVFPSRN